MGKLYPPIIEDTLPAFYDENGVVKITIPFSMNRAVNYSQIGGFELRIKTVQNGSFLYTVQTYNPIQYKIEGTNDLYVTFYLKDEINKLKVGQFYKFQLAYIQVDEQKKIQLLNNYYQGIITISDFEKEIAKEGIVSYYSNAGVAKYSTKPNVYINGLRKGFINSYVNSYTGCYEQINQDTTEKVYTYRFDVYNENNEICWTTGDLLHNSSLDTNADFSQDIYYLNHDIEEDKIYYIQYSITTINKISISTPKYKLIYRELIGSQLDVKINAELNFDNGYIDISLINNTDDYGLPQLVTGAFKLLRSDEDSNFKDWNELFKFKLNNEAPKNGKTIFRDFTFKQGKKYIYALQQYDDKGLYSSKTYSNEIVGDFEDAFLFDGERQLKIRYNPKITKFTNNRLEQKLETIGSQYPFIFRNGQVNYNEFPIGGLISYYMDEEHLFMSNDELEIKDKTINYTTDNIVQERVFKMKVLEWLNDGKPKLFRSPEEGNYIIRILKISLTPETKLGRLLHNFSGTAYEIAEYNHQNLLNYNFIKEINLDYDLVFQWNTINLKNYTPGQILNGSISSLRSVEFKDMIPGEQVLITLIDETQKTIVIGKTGMYSLKTEIPIQSIIIPKRYEKVKIPHLEEYNNGEYYIYKDGKYILVQNNESNTNYKFEDSYRFPLMEVQENQKDKVIQYYRIINKKLTGLMTYSYYTEVKNTFKDIYSVKIEDFTLQQFIGEYDILKEIKNVYVGNEYYKNPKTEITKYFSLEVSPRPVENFESIINNTTIKYYDSIINLEDIHPFTLYKNVNTNKYWDYTGAYQYRDYKEYQPYLILNGEKIYIDNTKTINLKQFDNIYELKSGNGVIVNLSYQKRTTTFSIEMTDQELINLKTVYEKSIQDLENRLSSESIKDENFIIEIKMLRQKVISNYNNYIIKLNKKLE